MYPMRRLRHQRPRPVNRKTRRLPDGMPVHKSKFRKAVRLYFKEVVRFRSSVQNGDDTTQCMRDYGIHRVCNVVSLCLLLFPKHRWLLQAKAEEPRAAATEGPATKLKDATRVDGSRARKWQGFCD